MLGSLAVGTFAGLAWSQGPGDHLGPVRCYVRATDATTIAPASAVQLCIGAASDAPARCLAQAKNRLLGFSDLELVQLCSGATSTEPVACAARSDDTTELSDRQIAQHCAALPYVQIPAQSAGAPICVETARDRTTLSDREALELCRGSNDVGPVACFEYGDDQTPLSAPDLISLCGAVEIIPGYYSPALHPYG